LQDGSHVADQPVGNKVGARDRLRLKAITTTYNWSQQSGNPPEAPEMISREAVITNSEAVKYQHGNFQGSCKKPKM
jgi:hypothetical protein